MQVRGSPKPSKVSFLQQKGLTEAEINEAFRRVPETPVPPLPTAQISYQPPSAPTSNALATTASHLAPPPQPTYGGAVGTQQQQPQQEPVRWSQVALGAGFVAASGYAFKSLFWPYLSDKYTAWRGVTPSRIAEPSTSATASLPPSEITAVADAIRAQTAELASSIEALKTLAASLDKRNDDIPAKELRQELSNIASTLNE